MTTITALLTLRRKYNCITCSDSDCLKHSNCNKCAFNISDEEEAEAIRVLFEELNATTDRYTDAIEKGIFKDDMTGKTVIML